MSLVLTIRFYHDKQLWRALGLGSVQRGTSMPCYNKHSGRESFSQSEGDRVGLSFKHLMSDLKLDIKAATILNKFMIQTFKKTLFELCMLIYIISQFALQLYLIYIHIAMTEKYKNRNQKHCYIKNMIYSFWLTIIGTKK